MANINNTPVKLEDAMTKGIEDAMVRIQEVGLKECDTLAAKIAPNGWDDWDMSDESPNVIDPNGISGIEDDGLVAPIVA